MLKYLSILTFAVLIFKMPLHSEIFTAQNASVLVQKIQESIDPNNAENNLIGFDVDEVLVRQYDVILDSKNRPRLQQQLKNIARKQGLKEAEKLCSIIMQNRKFGHVDEKISDFIKELQEKNLKIFALTHCFTGEFGCIPSMVDWRINDLRKLGFYFEKSWKGTPTMTFDGLPRERNSQFTETPGLPTFKDGILFASGVSKGELLKRFLSETKFTPTKIVFVDDKIENLESLEEAAKEFSVPFVGIEYTYMEDEETPVVDEEIINLQFEKLQKTNKWLSDEEIQKTLWTKNSYSPGDDSLSLPSFMPQA